MKILLRGKFLKCLLVIGIYSVSLSAYNIEAATKQIRINLGTIAPRGSSHHQTLLAMGEKWREAPGGGVKLVIYPDGIQGGESDMVRLMRVGSLHSALLTVRGLEDIEPGIAGLSSIPMVYRDLDELDYVIEKLQPELQKRLLIKGFVLLFWVDAGWVRYFSKQPVIYPDNLKKMKIFVWAGNPAQVEVMIQAGYYPVPLETSEIMPGLQTGLINVVVSPPFYALAGQIDNLAPHMLELNWGPLVGAVVIRSHTWNKIPDVTKEALQIAAADAGKKMKIIGREESINAEAAMKNRGLTVHPVSSKIEEEWRETATKLLYPRIRGNMVSADIFDEVIQLIQEYRTINKEAK